MGNSAQGIMQPAYSSYIQTSEMNMESPYKVYESNANEGKNILRSDSYKDYGIISEII